jgi:hypothetical protein
MDNPEAAMTVWYQPPDPNHPGQVIGVMGVIFVIAIASVLGVISWLSNQNREQKMEINRLSTTCADSQAGEKLIATILKHNVKDRWELRCVYSNEPAYGRSSRGIRVEPGRSS